MNKRDNKRLRHRINWMTRNLTENDIKGLRESIIDRESARFHLKWLNKVNKYIPSLSSRVFELRGKGNIYQHELEKTLAKVILAVNYYKLDWHEDYQSRMVGRICDEINVNELFKEVKKTEKTIKEKKEKEKSKINNILKERRISENIK